MKKVFISGDFNILHPGHIRLLRFAKECGDYLIVGLNNHCAEASKLLMPLDTRKEALHSLKYVDEVMTIDGSVDSVIKKIKPHIVVKGKEFESLSNIEKTVLESYGGKLIFSSGEAFFSYKELGQENNLVQKNIVMPEDFLLRNKISKNSLIELIIKMQSINVVVIGDLIVDEYINCETLGVSQEDPTIVVSPVDSSKYIGGAGIVSSHASKLGGNVEFLSVAGMDENRDFAISILKSTGVESFLLRDDERPTTLKQRYRCRGKTLLRVSKLHQNSISLELQNQIFQKIEKIYKEKKVHLLVFSDFNYGCLPQPLVEKLISLAKGNGTVVIADSQSSSQMGDISRFKGLSLLSPTEYEARASLKNREDGLVVLAEKLGTSANSKNVFLKLGKDGLIIHSRGTKGWSTEQINALNSRPVDVAGAGDSMLVTAGMALACGGSIWEAAVLGSLSAAIQVDRVGNLPISRKDLLHYLE